MNTLRPIFLLLGSFFVTASAHSQVPASVAGKVFRQRVINASVRSSGEFTVLLGEDGRCTVLRTGAGFALILPAPYKIFLTEPPADGTYTYRRTGETTATLELSTIGSRNFNSVYELRFTSDTAGTIGETAVGETFTLTDRTDTAATPLSNLSLRGNVVPGRPLIAGFVVPGTVEREVLVRVVGPTLAAFGVTNFWADPDFEIFRGNAPAPVNQVHYADWSVTPFNQGTNYPSAAAFQKIFAATGAFALPVGSKDAAQVVRLAPGAYTVVCTASAGDSGGEALIEVYTLP